MMIAQEASFQSNHTFACSRACRHVMKWLAVNRLQYSEIFFDKKEYSEEGKSFGYTIRAVDRNEGKAHVFDLLYNDSTCEIGYVKTSEESNFLIPGKTIFTPAG
ncbi:MAG: hypothetical protein GY754_46245 [bacterium]|nr:hypothetical protein [bacterium]